MRNNLIKLKCDTYVSRTFLYKIHDQKMIVNKHEAQWNFEKEMK